MRGEARVKQDVDVTETDIEAFNLILWGDPTSNSLLDRVVGELPLEWSADRIVVAGQDFAAKSHLPIMIHPNPLNPRNYVVLNSGHTFREGHDRTNSLQNPKLPDWAVIDLTHDPNDIAPGKVVAAGLLR